jgi:4-amino-4-deoxy-L-arabinose transferase-like glycosyltransferase
VNGTGEPDTYAGRFPALAAGAAAGVVALVLFAATAHHGVGSHDVAEFQTLARTGGIAHAGYPALVLVLEAMGRLPFGTLPYRANLVSVLAGSLAVAFAAWSGARLAGRALPGVVAALALALSITFWRESTQAGVHLFTLALAVPAFLLATRLAEQPRAGESFLLGVLGGLGLVSHLTILALVPVGLLAGFRAAIAGTLRWHHVVLVALGLLVGITPLATMLAYDRPDQPMNYIQDTLRPDNAESLSGGAPPAGRVARAAWLLSARQYLGGFVFSPFADTPQRAASLLLHEMVNDLPLWGLPLAALGVVVLWRRRDPLALFLAAWLGGVLFWLFYGALPGMVPIFFLPGLWVMSQCVAAGLGALARRARFAWIAAAVLLIATPFARLAILDPPGPLAQSGATRMVWRVAPEAWDPFSPDTTWGEYGRGVMRTLPPRAVVLACWEEGTTLRYFRYGEPLREDVDILYHCKVPAPAFAAADSAERPVFTTYEPTPEMTGGRAFQSVGRWTRGGLWRID